ncbi:MAG TPA: hypothetical protein VH416_01580 [Gaiellaceae bacterium]|jgi:hypothetical protein
MRKNILLVCILALVCALAAIAAAATRAADTAPAANDLAAKNNAESVQQAARAHRAAVKWLGGQIGGFQRSTWHWQRLMGRRLTTRDGRNLETMPIPAVKHTVALWHGRARAARRAAQHPPHLRQWLCIHRYEGSWQDTGAPYYGGLQMDWSFMSRYGGYLLDHKGTADRWTPLEQMWVAERALRAGRGFYAWPNTARSCGLL